MRLLIVEDDETLASALAAALDRRGIAADVATNLGDAQQMLEVAQYAAVLLDLGLPDGDGLALIRGLRSTRNPVPILAVTARGGIGDRVTGLDAGADDYLSKPFDVDELVARLNAVLRRQGALSGVRQTLGNVAFESRSGDLFVGDTAVLLSARERQLCALLFRRAGQVVSKRFAEDQLYGLSEPVGSNAVEVHAHRLRKKLELAGATVRIETIRGVGYMLREMPAEPIA